MDKKYSSKTVKEAKRLIADKKSYEGDHGFRGKQLTAWKEMRSDNLSSLKGIVAHKTPPIRDDWWGSQNWPTPDCPAEVENVDGTQTKGTKAGAAWANQVSSVLGISEDEYRDLEAQLELRDDYEARLKEAQREVTKAKKLLTAVDRRIARLTA